jgi:hypothetical protein
MDTYDIINYDRRAIVSGICAGLGPAVKEGWQDTKIATLRTR